MIDDWELSSWVGEDKNIFLGELAACTQSTMLSLWTELETKVASKSSQRLLRSYIFLQCHHGNFSCRTCWDMTDLDPGIFLSFGQLL